MNRGTAVFLDTSIQIARFVHDRQIKGRIRRRIAPYDLRVTSLVVRQEFRRRLLEEAAWCLNQLNHPSKPKTFEQLMRYIADHIPQPQVRQKRIRLQILMTIQEGPGNDRTERAKRHLRTLLRTGLSVFEDEIDHVIRDVECACASYPVVEKKPYKRYEFGPNKCSECDRACGVVPFLVAREDKLVEILERLKGLPNGKKVKADGTRTELGKIENFIAAFLASPATAREMNPCLTVGDLLIALESERIPDFYTINAKESQYLCRWMNQTLIVRKTFPVHEDIICDRADLDWPAFSS
jgi:hypothetical protein